MTNLGSFDDVREQLNIELRPIRPDEFMIGTAGGIGKADYFAVAAKTCELMILDATECARFCQAFSEQGDCDPATANKSVCDLQNQALRKAINSAAERLVSNAEVLAVVLLAMARDGMSQQVTALNRLDQQLFVARVASLNWQLQGLRRYEEILPGNMPYGLNS